MDEVLASIRRIVDGESEGIRMPGAAVRPDSSPRDGALRPAPVQGHGPLTPRPLDIPFAGAFQNGEAHQNGFVAPMGVADPRAGLSVDRVPQDGGQVTGPDRNGQAPGGQALSGFGRAASPAATGDLTMPAEPRFSEPVNTASANAVSPVQNSLRENLARTLDELGRLTDPGGNAASRAVSSTSADDAGGAGLPAPVRPDAEPAPLSFARAAPGGADGDANGTNPVVGNGDGARGASAPVPQRNGHDAAETPEPDGLDDEPLDLGGIAAAVDAGAPEEEPAMDLAEKGVSVLIGAINVGDGEDTPGAADGLEKGDGGATETGVIESISAGAGSRGSGLESCELEDNVSKLLRPMLKSWLDENMPKLVENALRADADDNQPD